MRSLEPVMSQHYRESYSKVKSFSAVRWLNSSCFFLITVNNFVNKEANERKCIIIFDWFWERDHFNSANIFLCIFFLSAFFLDRLASNTHIDLKRQGWLH